MNKADSQTLSKSLALINTRGKAVPSLSIWLGQVITHSISPVCYPYQSYPLSLSFFSHSLPPPLRQSILYLYRNCFSIPIICNLNSFSGEAGQISGPRLDWTHMHIEACAHAHMHLLTHTYSTHKAEMKSGSRSFRRDRCGPYYLHDMDCNYSS